jgi:hypothetical protein
MVDGGNCAEGKVAAVGVSLGADVDPVVRERVAAGGCSVSSFKFKATKVCDMVASTSARLGFSAVPDVEACCRRVFGIFK